MIIPPENLRGQDGLERLPARFEDAGHMDTGL